MVKFWSKDEGLGRGGLPRFPPHSRQRSPIGTAHAGLLIAANTAEPEHAHALLKEDALQLFRGEPLVVPTTRAARVNSRDCAPHSSTFERFCELLAAKESPYLDFLRQQAAQARAEQNRYLERAADRAYLAMHAPVAPLLAVLVLLLAYGFLRFLAQTV